MRCRSMNSLASGSSRPTSRQGHDQNWGDFQHYQRELIEYDPESAVDLVVVVLKIETHPVKARLDAILGPGQII